MDPKVIGENIRRHREKCHWTQEELAIAADIDARTVQRAERGQMVALDTLKAFASAFDTTIDELAKDPQEPENQPLRISWGCPELDAIWWSKTHSDRHSLYNMHVRTCRRCRDKKL